MHVSASMRSRPRTLTSCTECRRRKQKCNQTKDRPCSNCARRYPPVACTYLAHESVSPKSSRRGSPSEHIGDLPDRGCTTPTINEQMIVSDRTHESSNSAYGSLGSPADYSPLAIEQPAFPDSPDLFYSQMQTANYPQQNQYAPAPAATSSFYAPTSSGAYGGTIQAPSTTAGGQGYSSYYVPVSTTQANWSPVTTESPNFVALGGTYGTLGDLPLEPSPPNADLCQFFGPLPHAPLRRSVNMAWGLDPMDFSRPINISTAFV